MRSIDAIPEDPMPDDYDDEDGGEEINDALDALASASASGDPPITELDAPPKQQAERKPKSSARITMDPEGRLVGNAWCRSCTKSLVGHRIGETCENCGAPVIDSLDPRQLAFADHGWLVGLYQGINLMAVGTLIYVIFVAFGAGLLGYLQYDPRIIGLDGLTVHMLTVTHDAIALIGGSLIYGVSVWRITRPRPDELDPSFPHGLPVASRWMLIPTLVIEVVLAAVRSIVGGIDADNTQLTRILSLGAIPFYLIHLAAWLVMMVYLLTLTKLIPKRQLASETLLVTIALPATIIGGFGLLMLIAFLGSTASDPRSVLQGYFLGVLIYFIAVLAVVIWYIIVLFKHRRALAGVVGIDVSGKRKKR